MWRHLQQQHTNTHYIHGYLRSLIKHTKIKWLNNEQKTNDQMQGHHAKSKRRQQASQHRRHHDSLNINYVAIKQSKKQEKLTNDFPE